MMPTLYNGISGVKTHSFGIDIVGNNIANVNTIGYKSTRPEFNDILYQALSSAQKSPINNQSGVGSFGASSALMMHQGILKNTSRNLDVALEGKGYFGVLGDDGQNYYTRNGALQIDSENNLLDSSGHKILGIQNEGMKTITPSGAIKDMVGNKNEVYVFSDKLDLDLLNGEIKPLKVPLDSVFMPEPTSFVNIFGSLDVNTNYQQSNIQIKNANTTKFKDEYGRDFTNLSGEVIADEKVLEPKSGDRIIIKYSKDNAKASFVEAILDDDLKYSVDLKGDIKVLETIIQTKQAQPLEKEFATDIVDGYGNKSHLVIKISRKLNNLDEIKYDANATITGLDGKIVGQSNGIMEFDKNGVLKSNTLKSITSGSSTIKLGFGDGKNVNIDGGYHSLVAIDGLNAKSRFEKDGVIAGVFKELNIDERGNILLNYSNGRSQSVGKLAVYNFINEQGLDKAGENIYKKSANSGDAFFIQKEGRFVPSALIKSQYLEGSNVDLGNELTQMIIYQKAYEANAKSISTADAMLRRAIDMKR